MELRPTAGLFPDRSGRVHLQLLGDIAKVSKNTLMWAHVFKQEYLRIDGRKRDSGSVSNYMIYYVFVQKLGSSTLLVSASFGEIIAKAKHRIRTKHAFFAALTHFSRQF